VRVKDRAQDCDTLSAIGLPTLGNVPYGRSLTYRHCVAAYWGALALVDVEALPWA